MTPEKESVNQLIERLRKNEVDLDEIIKNYGLCEIPEKLRRARIYSAYVKQNFKEYLEEEQEAVV